MHEVSWAFSADDYVSSDSIHAKRADGNNEALEQPILIQYSVLSTDSTEILQSTG